MLSIQRKNNILNLRVYFNIVSTHLRLLAQPGWRNSFRTAGSAKRVSGSEILTPSCKTHILAGCSAARDQRESLQRKAE